MVHAGEKLAIVAHLRENGGHLAGVAERIDLPTNARTRASTEGVIKYSIWCGKKTI